MSGLRLIEITEGARSVKWLKNEGSIPSSGISGVLFPSSPQPKGPCSPPKEPLNMLFSRILSPGIQHSQPDDSSAPSRPTRVRNKSVKFSAAPTERISVKFEIGDLKNAVKK